MNDHNKIPNNAIEINSYKDFKKFFSYCIQEHEIRQIPYAKSILEGHFTLRLFWINKDKGLGYGIADDWKNVKIQWYLFGDLLSWKTFDYEFAEQFQGDDS